LIIGFFSVKDILKISIANKRVMDYILLIIIIFFCGLRLECDKDYNNYVSIYNATPLLKDGIKNIISFGILHGIEIGYLFVSAFFKTLGLAPQSIFIFSAIIMFCFLYKVFVKYTNFPAIALCIFFTHAFTLSFIQMRFGVATAIAFYACSLLPEKKEKQYFIFIILALSFHLSAMGSIAVFFFYKVDWMQKGHLIYFILFLSMVMVFLPLREILTVIMNSFGIDKYTRLYSEMESASSTSLLIMVFLVFPLIIFRRKLIKKNININFLLSMILAGIFVGSAVWQLGILSRFSIINTVAICLVIPAYLFLCEWNGTKIIGYFIIMAYCLFKFLPHLKYITAYNSFISNFF
jgi:hypothetical protein